MKLHLPKALFTAVIAAFAVSQTVWGETYDLLESSDNWTFTGRSPNPSYNADADSITTGDGDWKQNLATYTMVDDRSSFAVIESFAVTITTTGNDGVLTLGFTGSEQTFVLGDLTYSDTTLVYGTTTDTTSYVYHNGTAWDAGATANIDSVNSMDVEYAAGTYEMIGTVTYADGSYKLSMTINDTEYITDYNLGSTFDIDRITFGYDGTAIATLSKLTITGEKGYMNGYYATTLAEGSTNAADATWTDGSAGVNYADIAMTDGSAILDFTGAATGSTVVLGADPNVYAIDISGGSVTLQADSGSITTGELVVKSGATATIDADASVTELITKATSTLNVAADKTLTVGSLSIDDSTTALSIAKNGIIDLSSISLPDVGEGAQAMQLIKLINKTSGEGTVKLANAANYINSGGQKKSMTFDTNYEVGTDASASLHINSWHDAGSWKTHTVTEDGSITVGGGAGVLELQSGQKLLIEGGSVAAGQLALGHTSDGAAYSGAVEMTSGSLTVGEIKAQNIGSDSWKNTILLTGGTLTITGSEAITYATTARTDSTLGGSGDSALTLKTAGTDWSVSKGTTDGNSLTIGNITIDAANANMITIYDAAIVGDIQNNATAAGAGVTLSGAFMIEGGTSVVDKVMTDNGYGIQTTNIVIDNFKGAGNYVYADSMTINGMAITDYTREGNTFTYSTGEQTTTVYHVVNGTVAMESVGLVASDTLTGYDVYSGATLDAAGKNPEGITVNLRGGATLANSGNGIGNAAGTNVQQIKSLSLTGDATVDTTGADATSTNTPAGQLGIVASGLAATTVDLGGYKLTKTGAGNFLLMNTAISAGSIDIQEGTVKMYNQGSGGLSVDDSVAVNIAKGAALYIQGNKTDATINGDFLLKATGTGDININNVVNMGNEGGTSTFAGNINVNSNTLRIGQDTGNWNNMVSVNMEDATINLQGGGIRYYGGNSSFGALNVKQDATLELYATRQGSDAAIGALSFGTVSVDSEKTLTVNGQWKADLHIGVLTGAGALNVSLANKWVEIGAVEAGFGSITNAGTMTLGTASTTVNLGSTVTNTGTVTMLGSLVLSGDDYADFTVSGAQYDTTGDAVADADATDGYLVAAGATSFTVVNGGTINTDGITSVTYNGESVSTDSLSIADNKLTLSTQVAITPTKDYYVNTTVDYAADSVVASDDTTGIILNGGTLNLNTALNTAATKGIVAAQNSTINIASGVTLNNSSVSSDGGTATIAGADTTAVYAVTGGSNPTLNVELGSDWKGTVKLSSVTVAGTNLSAFANGANSSILFDGVTGYTAAGTYAFNTVLADDKDALIINNGGNNEQRTFTGTVSGSGNIVRKANTGSFHYYNFSGDVSGWTGDFRSENSHASHQTTVNLTGSATTVKADFIQDGANGKLNVVVDNTENVTMSGAVSAKAGTIKLQNKGTGKVTVDTVSAATNATVQLSGNGSNEIEIGSLNIAAGGSVVAGTTETKGTGNPVSTDDSAVKVTVKDTLTINSSNAISLDGALVLTGATVDLSGLSATLDTTTAQDIYVYTLGTATGGITGNPDGSINFTGINVDGYTAYLEAMPTDPTTSATMALDASTTNNYLVLKLEKDTTELTQVTVTGAQGYDSASNVLTLTTNIADIDDYSGIASTLAATVTDSLWEQLVKQYGIGTLVNIALVDEAGNYFDLDGADGTGDDVTLTVNGIGVNAPAPTYSAVGNGAAVGPYVTSYIPEPTTTTLSILALAALAVRRRRK